MPPQNDKLNNKLQCPVCWLPCRWADAVAICPKSSRSSCTRAAWPCFSNSSHANLLHWL